MPVKNRRWRHRVELTNALDTLPPTAAVVSVEAMVEGVYATGHPHWNRLALEPENLVRAVLDQA